MYSIDQNTYLKTISNRRRETTGRVQTSTMNQIQTNAAGKLRHLAVAYVICLQELHHAVTRKPTLAYS